MSNVWVAESLLHEIFRGQQVQMQQGIGGCGNDKATLSDSDLALEFEAVMSYFWALGQGRRDC